jgi:hypothetical protein
VIDNLLIADPPLRQVASDTVEGGVRGTFGKAAETGQMT